MEGETAPFLKIGCDAWAAHGQPGSWLTGLGALKTAGLPATTSSVDQPPKTLLRRYIEVAAFVVGWMALGFYLHLGNAAYQAVGVALTLLFQPLVARRPFCQLWVRAAMAWRFDRWTIALAIFFAGAAGAVLFLHVGRLPAAEHRSWMMLLLTVAAVLAAFALRQTTWAGLWRALPSIAAWKITGWGWALVVVWVGRLVGVAGSPGLHLPLRQWPAMGATFLCEFLGAFVIEEVVFRGALDTHVSAGETTRWDEFRSAAFVSVLWALYHVPIQGPQAITPIQQLGSTLHFVGIALAGMPLAFCWRRSGTLALPAALHAFFDAYVINALRVP